VSLRQRFESPERSWGGWRALVGVGRRSELSVSIVIAAMLAVVAFAAAAAPRLLTEAEASSLERAIELVPATDRRLAIRLIDDFGQGFNDDPLMEQRERLERVAAEIDQSVLARYGEPRLVADSSRFVVQGVDVVELPEDEQPTPPRSPALRTLLTFRIHPAIEAHSRLVDGRPAGRTNREINGMSILEFELTPESATELGWELGETIQLTTDPTDLVTRQFDGGLPEDFVAQLVGLRQLDDQDDPFWFGDARLHRPATADTGIGANVFAFAMIVPDQIPVRPFMVDRRSPFSIEQRRDLTDGAVNLDTAAETLDGLVALDASFARQPTLTRPGVLAGLRPVLEIERGQRRAARATLVLAAVGVSGVVLITLAQLLLASAERRRGWLTVARVRGASRRQVVVSAMAEMAIIAAAAVVAGVVLAPAVFGGSRTGLEISLLGGLWFGAVGAAGLIAMSENSRPITVSLRPTERTGLGRWGRLGGGLLVIVAVAALVTFRRRGLATDSSDVDILLALLPVLVPLAVVYLVRWVLPAVLRQIAQRGMKLGPGRLVGLRRAITSPDASTGLMAVLVLALTVAALGLGVNRSLEQGAIDASWIAVGAPYQVDSREPSLADAVRAIPDAVVSASGGTRINIERSDTIFNVQFITADLPQIRELTAGTSADQAYPEALESVDLSGRVPVIAAQRMGGQQIRIGDSFIGVGARAGQEFLVIEVRSAAFGRRNDWIVADRTVYATLAGAEPGFSALAIGVPDEYRADLEALLAAAGDDLHVRADVLADQRDDPLSRAVRAGYLIAGLMAVVLALLALVAVAVVTARQRRHEVAILGLLGVSRKQLTSAVASELAPAALAGVVTGSVVGWLVVRIYDGRFDLSPFAGGNPVSINVDVPALLAVGVVVAIASVGVILALVRRIVHAPVGEILRSVGTL
jgi:putative ABC transport system permease protein